MEYCVKSQEPIGIRLFVLELFEEKWWWVRTEIGDRPWLLVGVFIYDSAQRICEDQNEKEPCMPSATITLRPQTSGVCLESEDPCKIGFVRSDAEPCLYIDAKWNTYITLCVDDLLIAGKNGRNIAVMKVQLAAEFEMKDLRKLMHLLRMRITRTNCKIAIDQTRYICQVLER